MKLGSREVFRKLQRRAAGLQDQQNVLRPAKYTTLPQFDKDEEGVLAVKRSDYVNMFKHFTREVIPSMERRIEFDLLRHQFRHIENPVVKEALIKAYQRRVTTIRNMELNEDPIISRPVELQVERQKPVQDYHIKVPIKYVEQEQIGQFANYPYKEVQKYYKHYAPGMYEKEYFQGTKKFSVQLTEEGVKLIDFIRNARRDEKIYASLGRVQPAALQDTLYQEEVFQTFFGTLRGDLWQSLDKYRKDVQMHRMFVNSPVFDSIISTLICECSRNHSLLLEICDATKRAEIMDSLAQQIKNGLDPEQINSQLPEVFYKTVKSLQVGSHQVQLEEYKEKHFRVPEHFDRFRFPGFINCGNTVLVHGRQGTGKSGIILQTSLFGHKSGWAVITVPSGYHWTQSSTPVERHHDTGLYLQPQLAQEFLEQITEANREVFKTIPVNKEIWGKYNFSGVHDDDVDPVPNLYDKRRKYHFNDHQQFLQKEEIAAMAEQSIEFDTRLCYKTLQNPGTVLDIAEAAIANPKYCTSAIYEILEQLYKQDKVPVLVAVDGINWFYRPSSQPSFRYESDGGLHGFVPPYHMSLARAFMHLDGHKIRNGYKVAASSIYPYQAHTFLPKHIHYSENYAVELKVPSIAKYQGLPLDHYRDFCDYTFQNNGWVCADPFDQANVEQFWMETQGNMGETWTCMKIPWRTVM